MDRINRVNAINRRKFLQLSAGLTGLAATLTACGSSASPTPATNAAPDAAPASGAVDKGKLAKDLSWYTWGNYWSDDVLKKFTSEFGVKVKVDTYGANEEMEAKFKAGGNPGYDLVTPSDYMVAKMISGKLLEKIDFANVPNFKNIDPGHTKLYFDPANEYSVAHTWGTTGFIYDKTKVKEPITTWDQVMAWPAELKNKLSMLDDLRELLGVGLRYAGFSANTAKPEEIEAGKKALVDLKKKANYALSDSPGAKTNTVAGDIIGAQIYTNDAVAALRENPNLVYVIPGKVSTIWQDNLCIPTGGPSKYTAEVFINFLCRPDIAAENAKATGMTTPNVEVLKQALIDKDQIENKTFYVDITAKGDSLEYLRKGDPKVDELYQRAFDEIKAS